jgi:hypothetical protein
MIVIHYPTAFKALDGFIDLFNEKTEKSTQRLRTGAVMTAKEIIRIYGISLLKAGDVQEITKDNLPALQTNNQQLARLVKCSARTIQRHIARLRMAGIITHKTFRGSNANYELLINPEILLVKEKLTVEKARQLLDASLEKARQDELKTLDTGGSTSKCPHTYSCNTSNKKNNRIIAVDNSKRSSQPLTSENFSSNATGNMTGNAGEIVQANFKKQIFEKNFEEAGEIVSRAAPSGHRDARPDAVRDNSLILYPTLLWTMARNLLYRNMDLTERQVSIAKQLIYKLYEPLATELLSKAHSQYVERIALVDKYIRKDPGKRFVTLPYLYFDTNNPNGFAGTKKWFYDDQKRKTAVQCELTVSRLIRSYLNNEKKEGGKRKPSLHLFRQYENTIGKFNNPALLQRFHAAVLSHDTYSYTQAFH